ncbi:glycosyltransferase family protein [Zhenhengia yiwuensis]|uniref:Uncharacterized protein n=1 Tax=Zhenhengia yiwuensis TaxID=2763666 RepID=A0A926EI27_9FIRM|nr:hypothetical protein [Zhenhengia yiwuensis]MBC8578955.1 hypothetical protein [Zhenhengia yiwuensis]
MRVIIVHIGEISYCPPALNVINSLEDLNYEVIVCTTKSKFDLNKKFNKNTIIREIDINYEKKIGLLNKFIRMIKIKNKIWKEIDKYYNNDAIIWVVSDIGIKHLGKKLLEKKYILHLMELSEKLTYYHKIRFLKMNEKEYGNKAFKVVVPEYNRAHIVKAWWGLERLPEILTNKPYNKIEVSKESKITKSDTAKEIISKLKGRKIILYQGIIHKERPLDKFIKAIDLLGDEYAFVLMSKGENIYKDIQSNNFYYIPFVEPPYHLEITSHAYIGILSYFPVESDYSILNALFCAPNKTYEYSMFGIPMVSNDVPALKYLFETRKCGKCIEKFNEDNICQAILEIEAEYKVMSDNARGYFEEVDIKDSINKILL